MKKLLTILITIIITIVGYTIYLDLKESSSEMEQTDISNYREQQEIIQETNSETKPVTKDELTTEDAIKNILVEKYNWVAEDILVTVNTDDGMYASGGVRSIDSMTGGGGWFASKKSGDWEVIYDGNGVIMCSNLVGHEDFPGRLIPECYDESTQEIVIR